jgi:hypothetical protein
MLWMAIRARWRDEAVDQFGWCASECRGYAIMEPLAEAAIAEGMAK